MKILVIDNDKDRGENLRDRIRKLCTDKKLVALGVYNHEYVVHERQVAPEDTNCYKAIEGAKSWRASYKNDYHPVTKEQYILLLLHKNNMWVQKVLGAEQNSFYYEKCREIPTVFYSGGGCSDPSDGLTYYHKKSVDSGRINEGFFLEEFLLEWAMLTGKEGIKEGEIKYASPPFDVLLYRTREYQAYEHAYDVLPAFLPLDIELQVANNQGRCRREIERLLERKGTINLDRIRTLIAEQENKLPEEIDGTLNSTQTALSGLFEQVETIKAKLSNEDFESVREQVFESFHEGYTQLRDKLLEVVYAFEGVKS